MYIDMSLDKFHVICGYPISNPIKNHLILILIESNWVSTHLIHLFIYLFYFFEKE